MTRPTSKFALLRSSFSLLLVSSLVILPNVSFATRAAVTKALQDQHERSGNPKPGKSEATLPNLDVVRAERIMRETPIPIPSTIASRKNPSVPWDGRRVGEPSTNEQ